MVLYGTLAPSSTQRPSSARSASVIFVLFAGGIVRVTTARSRMRVAYVWICSGRSNVTPAGAAAIVEWFKGSGLLPFLEPLDAPSRAAYLERYTAAVARAYPIMPDGSVLLPFPRLFMVTVR